MPPVNGTSTSKAPAVVGDNTASTGLPHDVTDLAGVVGKTKRGHGVVGISAPPQPEFAGVWGSGVIGVHGSTENGTAVRGFAHGTGGGIGMFGQGPRAGVVGNCTDPNNPGVLGIHANTGVGVAGVSHNNAGVFGSSEHGAGIVGEGPFAAIFRGNVEVTGGSVTVVRGDIVIKDGADFAEPLPTSDLEIEPGAVVVLDVDGTVRPCDREYDTAVAGVVSGACGVKPAIVFGEDDHSANVALIGKVWCHADADQAPIRPGDLLTTSSTVGHCRRVTEPARAFGAVIGKALTPLAGGQGMVRVLISPR